MRVWPLRVARKRPPNSARAVMTFFVELRVIANRACCGFCSPSVVPGNVGAVIASIVAVMAYSVAYSVAAASPPRADSAAPLVLRDPIWRIGGSSNSSSSSGGSASVALSDGHIAGIKLCEAAIAIGIAGAAMLVVAHCISQRVVASPRSRRAADARRAFVASTVLDCTATAIVLAVPALCAMSDATILGARDVGAVAAATALAAAAAHIAALACAVRLSRRCCCCRCRCCSCCCNDASGAAREKTADTFRLEDDDDGCALVVSVPDAIGGGSPRAVRDKGICDERAAAATTR